MSAVAEVIDPASLTALRGPQVSETALRELMPGARAIHVAAPFRINGASPLFSPLLLAEEKSADPPGSRSDSASDGSLDAREIMNLTLGAQVAVLSDGSAMSMRDAADDAVMIQWAWRAAGVPHLLVARWMTDVPAADQLLAVFHRRLSDGDPPAVALRAAQKAVRGTDLQSAPHYWAGWMLLSGR
jgi:hypothetical protein